MSVRHEFSGSRSHNILITSSTLHGEQFIHEVITLLLIFVVL